MPDPEIHRMPDTEALVLWHWYADGQGWQSTTTHSTSPEYAQGMAARYLLRAESWGLRAAFEARPESAGPPTWTPGDTP
jgi:hypothetical protein